MPYIRVAVRPTLGWVTQRACLGIRSTLLGGYSVDKAMSNAFHRLDKEFSGTLRRSELPPHHVLYPDFRIWRRRTFSLPNTTVCYRHTEGMQVKRPRHALDSVQSLSGHGSFSWRLSYA